jgi:hypothetical protein
MFTPSTGKRPSQQGGSGCTHSRFPQSTSSWPSRSRLLLAGWIWKRPRSQPIRHASRDRSRVTSNSEVITRAYKGATGIETVPFQNPSRNGTHERVIFQHTSRANRSSRKTWFWKARADCLPLGRSRKGWFWTEAQALLWLFSPESSRKDGVGRVFENPEREKRCFAERPRGNLRIESALGHYQT